MRHSILLLLAFGFAACATTAPVKAPTPVQFCDGVGCSTIGQPTIAPSAAPATPAMTESAPAANCDARAGDIPPAALDTSPNAAGLTLVQPAQPPVWLGWMIVGNSGKHLDTGERIPRVAFLSWDGEGMVQVDEAEVIDAEPVLEGGFALINFFAKPSRSPFFSEIQIDPDGTITAVREMDNPGKGRCTMYCQVDQYDLTPTSHGVHGPLYRAWLRVKDIAGNCDGLVESRAN